MRGDLGAGGADLPHEDDVTKTVNERVFHQMVEEIQASVGLLLARSVGIRVLVPVLDVVVKTAPRRSGLV